MFALDLKEYRPPGNALADYLPWAYMASEGVVGLKTGAFSRTLAYRGQDLRSMTREERVVVSAQLNAAVMRLGEGWALFGEVQRRPSSEYRLGSARAGAATRIVEQVRRENFACSGALFETDYYLTLVWTPPVGALGGVLTRVAGALGGLFTGGEQLAPEGDTSRARAEALDYFERATREFHATLSTILSWVHWLDESETLTYLHSTISTLRHRVEPPLVPMYLDALLPDELAEFGVEGRLGPNHVRVVSIKGYPSRTHPNFMRALEQFGFNLRLCTRYLALSPAESRTAVTRYQSLFFQKRKNLVVDALNKGQGPVNAAALTALGEIEGVLSSIDQGYVTKGYHTCAVVVWDPDHARCLGNAEAVMTAMRALGYVCVDEGANLKAAWLATHPGNVWASPRRALISSLNLSHMFPTASVWAGEEQNAHLGGPPHMYCVSEESAPFRLNLNVGDVGHTMVLGPTGSGKSVLLGMLELSWPKYEGGQVFIFDKGRSSRCTTLAAGGHFIELSLEHPELTFAPLLRVDEPKEAAFATEWLEEVVTLQGEAVGVGERLELVKGVRAVAGLPAHLRTLTSLTLQLQHDGLRHALADFASSSTHGAGRYARMWDNSAEALTLTDWTAIEMGPLMDSAPRIVAMTLRYLFHRLEERFTGRPTLLVLDEAWVFLDDPLFAPRLRAWLKELRKYNVYVVFATQDVTDALSSPIAPALVANTATQILLPNPKAMTPQMRPAYERLGLSPGQVRLLSVATPKREYYLRNALGDRLFSLALSPLELALVGASTPTDHEFIDAALARSKASGRSFLHCYLGARGFGSYAQSVR
jgi:type IV secretion system protein VirB4